MKIFNRDHIFTHRKRPHWGDTKYHFDFKITVNTLHFSANEYFMPNSVYCIYRKGNKVKRLKSTTDLLALQDVSDLVINDTLKFKSKLFQDQAHKYRDRYKDKDKCLVIRQTTQLPGEKIYIDVGYLMLPLHEYAMRESPFDTTIQLYDPQNLAAAEVDIRVEHKERNGRRPGPQQQPQPQKSKQQQQQQSTHLQMSEQRLEFLRRKSDLTHQETDWTAEEQEQLRVIAPSELHRISSSLNSTANSAAAGEVSMQRQDSSLTMSSGGDPTTTTTAAAAVQTKTTVNSKKRYPAAGLAATTAAAAADEKEDDASVYSRDQSVVSAEVGFRDADFDENIRSNSNESRDSRSQNNRQQKNNNSKRSSGGSDRRYQYNSNSSAVESTADYEQHKFPTAYQLNSKQHSRSRDEDEEEDVDDDKSESVVAVSVTPSNGPDSVVSVSKGYYNPNRSSRSRSGSHASGHHHNSSSSEQKQQQQKKNRNHHHSNESQQQQQLNQVLAASSFDNGEQASYSRAVTYKKISSNGSNSINNSSPKTSRKLSSNRLASSSTSSRSIDYNNSTALELPHISTTAAAAPPPYSDVAPPAYAAPPPAYYDAPPPPQYQLQEPSPIPVAKLKNEVPFGSNTSAAATDSNAAAASSAKSDKSERGRSSRAATTAAAIAAVASTTAVAPPYSSNSNEYSSAGMTPEYSGSATSVAAAGASISNTRSSNRLSGRSQITAAAVTTAAAGQRPIPPPQRILTTAANGSRPTAPAEVMKKSGTGRSYDAFDDRESVNSESTYGTLVSMGTASMAGSQAARRLMPMRGSINGSNSITTGGNSITSPIGAVSTHYSHQQQQQQQQQQQRSFVKTATGPPANSISLRSRSREQRDKERDSRDRDNRERDGSPESQRSGRSQRSQKSQKSQKSQRSQVSNLTGVSTATGRAKLMVPVRVPGNNSSSAGGGGGVNMSPRSAAAAVQSAAAAAGEVGLSGSQRSLRRSNSNIHRGTALDRGSVAGQFPAKYGESQFESGNPLGNSKGHHSRTHSNVSYQSMDSNSHSQYDLTPGMTFMDNPAAAAATPSSPTAAAIASSGRGNRDRERDNNREHRDDASSAMSMEDSSVRSGRHLAYRYLPESHSTAAAAAPEKLYADARQNLGHRRTGGSSVNSNGNSSSRRPESTQQQQYQYQPPPSPTPSVHSTTSNGAQLTFKDYHRKKSEYEMLQAEQYEAQQQQQQQQEQQQQQQQRHREHHNVDSSSRASGATRDRPSRTAGRAQLEQYNQQQQQLQQQQQQPLKGTHARMNSMDSMQSINSGISSMTGTLMDDGDNNASHSHHRNKRYSRVQVPNHR